jgi:hypothetical protein
MLVPRSNPYKIDADQQDPLDLENLLVGVDPESTPPGTRTPNPLVKSQLLCQLS